MVTSKDAADLKPVLMEPTAKKVKTPYYLIEEAGQTMFVVSPGRNGSEFNKTIGYLSNFPGMQTYFCLYGSGILLMQRNDEHGEAKEFRMVVLNPLKQVSVPVGWAMCLVNTGSKLLTVLRNTNLEAKYQDEKPILHKKGLAYYVVEKKGEITFEQNPAYHVHPQITTE